MRISDWSSDVCSSDLNANGLDVIMGGDGSDVILVGVDATEVFAGEGNDFILGGDDMDFLMGNEGDDWIEGGDVFDTLVGENSELFFNSTIIGQDRKSPRMKSCTSCQHRMLFSACKQ